MEFVKAVTQYYSIATKLATPNVQAALRLMKTSGFWIRPIRTLIGSSIAGITINFYFYKENINAFFLEHP